MKCIYCNQEFAEDNNTEKSCAMSPYEVGWHCSSDPPSETTSLNTSKDPNCGIPLNDTTITIAKVAGIILDRRASCRERVSSPV